MNTDTKILKAVIKQMTSVLTKEEAIDELLQMRSADDGVTGFVYYYDTIQFYRANKKLIVEMVLQEADEQGVDVAKMVLSWPCLKNSGCDEADVYYTLFGNAAVWNIANALAWFALERAAYNLQNEKETENEG